MTIGSRDALGTVEDQHCEPALLVFVQLETLGPNHRCARSRREGAVKIALGRPAPEGVRA